MKYVSILAFSFSLYASTLLTVEEEKLPQKTIYRLTFDAPYTGNIQTQSEGNNTLLYLNDATYEGKKEFGKNSLEGNNSQTILSFKETSPKFISASKSTDGYLLQFDIHEEIAKATLSNSSIETKPELELGWRYFAVIVLLSILLGFLVYIKRKNSLPFLSKNNSWLFKNKTPSFGIKTLYQKNLDPRHKISFFEFEGHRYLVLLAGNSSLLLDKSPALPIEVTEGDFASILHSNQAKLDFFLRDEKFEDFKTKAEKIDN